ncbi:unnamed protein product, partial [Amoebophrya sp. A120]|eukprot:GSA120T00008821001.1
MLTRRTNARLKRSKRSPSSFSSVISSSWQKIIQIFRRTTVALGVVPCSSSTSSSRRCKNVYLFVCSKRRDRVRVGGSKTKSRRTSRSLLYESWIISSCSSGLVSGSSCLAKHSCCPSILFPFTCFLVLYCVPALLVLFLDVSTFFDLGEQVPPPPTTYCAEDKRTKTIKHDQHEYVIGCKGAHQTETVGQENGRSRASYKHKEIAVFASNESRAPAVRPFIRGGPGGGIVVLAAAARSAGGGSAASGEVVDEDDNLNGDTTKEGHLDNFNTKPNKQKRKQNKSRQDLSARMAVTIQLLQKNSLRPIPRWNFEWEQFRCGGEIFLPENNLVPDRSWQDYGVVGREQIFFGGSAAKRKEKLHLEEQEQDRTRRQKEKMNGALVRDAKEIPSGGGIINENAGDRDTPPPTESTAAFPDMFGWLMKLIHPHIGPSQFTSDLLHEEWMFHEDEKLNSGWVKLEKETLGAMALSGGSQSKSSAATGGEDARSTSSAGSAPPQASGSAGHQLAKAKTVVEKHRPSSFNFLSNILNLHEYILPEERDTFADLQHFEEVGNATLATLGEETDHADVITNVDQEQANKAAFSESNFNLVPQSTSSTHSDRVKTLNDQIHKVFVQAARKRGLLQEGAEEFLADSDFYNNLYFSAADPGSTTAGAASQIGDGDAASSHKATSLYESLHHPEAISQLINQKLERHAVDQLLIAHYFRVLNEKLKQLFHDQKQSVVVQNGVDILKLRGRMGGLVAWFLNGGGWNVTRHHCYPMHLNLMALALSLGRLDDDYPNWMDTGRHLYSLFEPNYEVRGSGDKFAGIRQGVELKLRRGNDPRREAVHKGTRKRMNRGQWRGAEDERNNKTGTEISIAAGSSLHDDDLQVDHTESGLPGGDSERETVHQILALGGGKQHLDAKIDDPKGQLGRARQAANVTTAVSVVENVIIAQELLQDGLVQVPTSTASENTGAQRQLRTGAASASSSTPSSSAGTQAEMTKGHGRGEAVVGRGYDESERETSANIDIPPAPLSSAGGPGVNNYHYVPKNPYEDPSLLLEIHNRTRKLDSLQKKKLKMQRQRYLVENPELREKLINARLEKLYKRSEEAAEKSRTKSGGSSSTAANHENTSNSQSAGTSTSEDNEATAPSPPPQRKNVDGVVAGSGVLNHIQAAHEYYTNLQNRWTRRSALNSQDLSLLDDQTASTVEDHLLQAPPLEAGEGDHAARSDEVSSTTLEVEQRILEVHPPRLTVAQEWDSRVAHELQFRYPMQYEPVGAGDGDALREKIPPELGHDKLLQWKNTDNDLLFKHFVGPEIYGSTWRWLEQHFAVSIAQLF